MELHHRFSSLEESFQTLWLIIWVCQSKMFQPWHLQQNELKQGSEFSSSRLKITVFLIVWPVLLETFHQVWLLSNKWVAVLLDLGLGKADSSQCLTPLLCSSLTAFQDLSHKLVSKNLVTFLKWGHFIWWSSFKLTLHWFYFHQSEIWPMQLILQRDL